MAVSGSAAALPRARRVPSAPVAWRRTLLYSSATLALGLGGHLLGGGSVDGMALVLATAPLVALCRVACGRELSLRILLLTIALGQVWLHVVGSFCGHAWTWTPAMLGWHAVATVALAFILRRREALLWSRARGTALTYWLRRLLASLAGSLPRPSTAVSLQASTVVRAATNCLALAVPDHRGPPAALSA